MFKIRCKLKENKIVKKPRNVESASDSKLYKMGYRCFYDKIRDVKISSRKSEKRRFKKWYRGSKCITVSDIVNDIGNVPENA